MSNRALLNTSSLPRDQLQCTSCDEPFKRRPSNKGISICGNLPVTVGDLVNSLVVLTPKYNYIIIYHSMEKYLVGLNCRIFLHIYG